MGCVWVYMQKMEPRYWWEYGDEKTIINKLNLFIMYLVNETESGRALLAKGILNADLL